MNELSRFVWYLFIDQNSSDEVISGLVVKIVSEELSNLKTREVSHETDSLDFPDKRKLTCGEQMLMWQSRRSCLISNSSLPLWNMFCKKRATFTYPCRTRTRTRTRKERLVFLLPRETVVSSDPASSDSVKAAGSCCPRQQSRHLPRSETCDLVTTPSRPSSSLRYSSPFFCAAWGHKTIKNISTQHKQHNHEYSLLLKALRSYLCSCSASLRSIFDTTSPYTSTKSERTRDFASTSLRTSPRDRYMSEVMMCTVLGELGRHHLDFLSGHSNS